MNGKKLSLFLVAAILAYFHCAEAAQESPSTAGVLSDHTNDLDTAPSSRDEQGSNPTTSTNALLRASSSSSATPRLLATSSGDDSKEVINIFQSDTTPPPLCPYAIQNKFEVLMSPDNNYHQNKFHVFRLFSNYTIDRKVLAQNNYTSADPDQSTSRCLYTIFCYKLIVYDSAGDGICCESGNGSYKAYWNGEWQNMSVRILAGLLLVFVY